MKNSEHRMYEKELKICLSGGQGTKMKQTAHLKCIIIWSRKKVKIVFCWSVASCLFFNQLVYLKRSQNKN